MPTKGQKMSDEQRKKISERARIKMTSPEMRAILSEKAKIRASTPEAKAKMSERAKALWASPEMRANLSEKIKARNSLPEVKKKIAMRNFRRKVSQETGNKLSEINKGKTLTEESIKLRTKHFNKEIMCLETGRVFKNQATAARELGCSTSMISNSISKKRVCILGTFVYVDEYMEEQNRSRHENAS